MEQLLLQIIFRQWDKGQRSEQEIQQRAALPDRYPVEIPPAKTLDAGQIILDQHGDDRLGNRLQYRQNPNNVFVLDRFSIDRAHRQLAYNDDSSLMRLGLLTAPWVQCRYQWRYRVHESDIIFWLYEMVILNAAIMEDFDPGIFISKPAAKIHDPLTSPTSSSALKLTERTILKK